MWSSLITHVRFTRPQRPLRSILGQTPLEPLSSILSVNCMRHRTTFPVGTATDSETPVARSESLAAAGLANKQNACLKCQCSDDVPTNKKLESKSRMSLASASVFKYHWQGRRSPAALPALQCIPSSQECFEPSTDSDGGSTSSTADSDSEPKPRRLRGRAAPPAGPTPSPGPGPPGRRPAVTAVTAVTPVATICAAYARPGAGF
jgi:hypothetical protein